MSRRRRPASLPRLNQIDEARFSDVVYLDLLLKRCKAESKYLFSTTTSSLCNSMIKDQDNSGNVNEVSIPITTTGTNDKNFKSTKNLGLYIVVGFICFNCSFILLVWNICLYQWGYDVSDEEILAGYRSNALTAAAVLNAFIYILNFEVLGWIPICFSVAIKTFNKLWYKLYGSKTFKDEDFEVKAFITNPIDDEKKRAFKMTKYISILYTGCIWAVALGYEDVTIEDFEKRNFSKLIPVDLLKDYINYNYKAVYIFRQQFWRFCLLIISSIIKCSFSCFCEGFVSDSRILIGFIIWVVALILNLLSVFWAETFKTVVTKEWYCGPDEFISVVDFNGTNDSARPNLRSPFKYEQNITDMIPCQEILSHGFRGAFKYIESLSSALYLLLLITFILCTDPWKDYFKQTNVLHIPYVILILVLVFVANGDFHTRFKQLFP